VARHDIAPHQGRPPALVSLRALLLRVVQLKVEGESFRTRWLIA
jgi:hypothetical protein